MAALREPYMDRNHHLLKGDEVYLVTTASLAHMTPAVVKVPPDLEGHVCVETASGIKFLPASDVIKRPRTSAPQT